MNRRDFLLSTTGLALAPSTLLGQEPSKSATDTKDIVFADFENGTYDGWTLSGDFRGRVPASDQSFPGKITGFQGKRFLCTYHPTLGNNATGKAVSKEFTIERPFINFLIGGGNHPNEACMNLVVDGKMVRTSTGNGSADLGKAYWDVSGLYGKTARLEVIDSTNSPDRGYIMVDNIVFSDTSPLRPQRMLEQLGKRPFFIANSLFYENEKQRQQGRYLNWGVTEDQFDSMVDNVWLQMCDQRYMPYADIPLERIAGYVKEVVEAVEQKAQKTYIVPLTPIGHQWLTAEAVCAWTCLHVKRDVEMDRAIERDPSINNIALAYPEVVLKRNPPLAQCAGYSLVTREVARKLGLTSHILQGTLRNPHGGSGGHCFTVFNFAGNLNIPADTTTPCTSQEVMRWGGKIRAFGILPRRREEWELYHAMYYNWTPIPNTIVNYNDARSSHKLLDMSEEDWKHINISGYAALYDRLTRHTSSIL